jgi:hypothetical protein
MAEGPNVRQRRAHLAIVRDILIIKVCSIEASLPLHGGKPYLPQMESSTPFKVELLDAQI